MPSLTDIDERHTVIDRRDGEYLCFPDVVRSGDGTLVVAYNESDKHVQPNRRTLLVRSSRDGGQTWGDIVRMDVEKSHCPRLTLFPGNEILLADHADHFHRSLDNGLTWKPLRAEGLRHDMFDRVLDLGNGGLLTTGHNHVGKPYSAIGQANTEQMVYRSDDGGCHWKRLGPIAMERNLVLCEASMVALPDGRILALLRENSFVYEPMYVCLSGDFGNTWSRAVPTPLIGHRPTMGLIEDGRLLVTYRNVAPDPGTAAWVGTLDELLSGFRVHGRHAKANNPAMTSEGLRVKNEPGLDGVVRYALRPMTDPRTATASLEAEVRVDEAGTNGCGLRLGVWWRLYPDCIVPETFKTDKETGAMRSVLLDPIAIPMDRFNTIRLDYGHGEVTLSVNGREMYSLSVGDDLSVTRPILVGAPYPFEENEVDCTWRSISQRVDEPLMGETYEWRWEAGDGMPDQWALDNVLELKNDRHAASPDFGYSGWTTMEDGSFYCVHHHGGGDDEDYEPLFTAHVMGTRFSLDDFEGE